MIAPRGVEEGVIWVVMAAEADSERGDRRGGSMGTSVAGDEDMMGGSEGSGVVEESVIARNG